MRVIALAAVLFLFAASAGAGGAVGVYGSATLNGGSPGSVSAISCSAPGDCAAGGGYRLGRYHEASVVSETNGSWDKAIEVPGMATLNRGGNAHVDSISCAAAGECAAGGHYTD